MKTKLLALLTLGLAGFAQADLPKVIIISPNDLVDAWQGYAADRTTGEYEVVNAKDIYANYPYATGEAGKPRNPAESIHAFIRDNAAEGVSYFMLGGAWFDAQNLEKKVYFQGTDTVLGLDNAIPGVYANVVREDGSVATIPSDLYYACHEQMPANGYQWDGNGDEVYLNDVAYTQGVTNYDLTPDVVVSRVSLKSATGINGYWISLNGGSTDLAQMVANFSAKVKRLEDGSFGGYNNYSIIAGAVTGDAATERNGLAALKRMEFSFYDGLPNFFDADHAKVGNETTELIARRRIRDQIAPYRPIKTIDVISARAWSRDHANFDAARDAYLSTDHAFDMMYSHGLVYESVWMMAVGGAYLTPGTYGTMKGLTAFADYAGPCCGSTPDLSFVRNEKTYSDTSITDAMILNPEGGAVAAVGNTRGGWYDKSFTLELDRDMSWILANRMLTGFVQEGKTAGETWKQAVASYVTDKRIANSTHLWLLIEDMFSGDPLVKLPTVIRDQNLTGEQATNKRILYTGAEGKTDSVISMKTESRVTSIPDTLEKLKVMNQLDVASDWLEVAVEGGIGGKGVVFAPTRGGTLNLTGDKSFFVDAAEKATVQIGGSNKTINLDGLKNSTFVFNSGTNVVLRSQTRGAIASKYFTLPADSELVLATYDVFGDNGATIYVRGSAKLVIAANPYSNGTERKGESLKATLDLDQWGAEKIEISVARGGLYTPASALVGDSRVTYTVDGYNGLGGSVVVPSGASLKLKQLPLVGLTAFDVQAGATLKLPEDATLSDLLDCNCVAKISKDAKVYVGETLLTLETDQEIDGKAYVGEKVVYLKPGTSWPAAGVELVNKYGDDASYSGEEKIIIQDADYPEMWISATFDSATFEIDGGSVQVENEGNSKTTFADASVSLTNGAKLNFRDHWNGVAIVDSTIEIADGCAIGEDATYPMRKPIDIQGDVKIVGDMTDVEFPHGFNLTNVRSTLAVTPMRDDSLVVTSGVEGYLSVAERHDDLVVYSLVEDPDYVSTTAFGKTWTYFYTGVDDDLAHVENWSTVADGHFVSATKAPLVTGSEAWDPALFDGEKMALEASEDGYKHITSSAKVEGWALKIGLMNGVCLTINELEKFQISGSATQYAYVDTTSKLVVKKFNAGKNCAMPFHIAAEEGLVWEADSTATGNTFVYSFSGNGSATFVGASTVAAHQIAAAEIALGEGDGKTILSKKLIAFNPEKTNTSTCGFASEVRIVSDDPEVLGVTKNEPVTTDDDVGTCSLRKGADGLYLDYVGREKVVERHTFSVGKDGVQDGNFYFDGKPFLIRCGEMHYGRIPRGYWRDRIRKTKAMGFNAVCAYMFWNNHEPVPGHFRFDGEQDVRAFCKIAQEEGLWIVLRPGPYTCAEWEFGGYPWWLLSSKMSEDGTINIRTKDADYRQYTDRYMQKVGEQLADMQVTRGGNIIMIQVENEYGTYGNDAEYMKMEYDAIVNAGFTEIPKFTCNPTFNNGVTNARIPELFYVVNGSGGFFDGENRMQKLIDARLPGWENAPLMVGEYYTAWYDSWGGTHQTKAASAIVNDFATFIERNVSFSVYMVYGGTSFGWWGGFNTPFVPMTTSYDYDSPINETGKLTDKFYAIKELFDQHMNDGETAVPAEEIPEEIEIQTGTIAAPPTYASLWNATTYTKEITEPTDAPLTFENADLGYGYAIYETTLAAGQGGKLMADCRDLGVVRVDGEFAGYLDRRTTWGWVEIEPADHPRKLEILVEALGRNHYAAFNDASKGLRGKPTLDKVPLSGWTMKTFDFLKWDDAKGAYASEMDNLEFVADANPSARSGSFYKYNVTLDPTKDALLDMRAWRRGMVCVNGIWVGRYWTIGPQQTLYIPGCWLKAGENANEIIILDTVGVEPQNELTFSATHIINENRSDLDYYTPPELPELPKSLEALWGAAVKTGNLANNRSLQTVNFDAPATGRYVAFKATSAHSEQYAACAEFNLLDAEGNALDRSNWTIVSCSSQEQRGEDAQIEKLIDGDNSTIWHSEWKVVQSTLPQYFVIDLGEEKEIGGFTWLGRQSGDAGFVNDYSVYVTNSDPVIDPETGITVSTGTLEEPFTIAAADLNNVPVLINSGAVLKVNATGNCKLTISGEGKDSVLIVGGGNYGFAEGSVFRNLTIQVDPGCNIWFETRELDPYDETVNVVVPTGATATLNNDGNFGNVITIGSLTVDGGTVVIWKTSGTSMNVTDTLYLREGATKPAGVTLAEGAKVEYLVEPVVDLVWDNTKTDWNDGTQAYRGTELVAIGADDTVVFKNFTGVLYDKRSNKTALKLEVREGDLKIGHDGYLNNGNGAKNLPDGSVVTIAEGSKVVLQAWDRSTQSEKTVNLAGAVTFDGPGSVELAEWITTAVLGSINGTAALNLHTATVTLRDGTTIGSMLVTSLTAIPTVETKVVNLATTATDKVAVTNVALANGTDITDQVVVTIKADGIYVVPQKPAVSFDDPETIAETTTAADLGLTNAAFTGDDGTTLKAVAEWAKATGMTLDALNAIDATVAGEAYLLNVAPDATDVEDAKADFAFDAEDLAALLADPRAKPQIGTGEYNGKVKILGAETVRGPYTEDNAKAKFFKAVLAR